MSALPPGLPAVSESVTCGRTRWIKVNRLREPCVPALMRACVLTNAPVSTAPRRPRRAQAMHDGAAQSDEALLTAIAAGDRSAFAAFFQRYAGKVKAYLIRLGARGARPRTYK